MDAIKKFFFFSQDLEKNFTYSDLIRNFQKSCTWYKWHVKDEKSAKMTKKHLG